MNQVREGLWFRKMRLPELGEQGLRGANEEFALICIDPFRLSFCFLLRAQPKAQEMSD